METCISSHQFLSSKGTLSRISYVELQGGDLVWLKIYF